MIAPQLLSTLVSVCWQCGHREMIPHRGCTVIAPSECPTCGSEKPKLEKASIVDKLLSRPSGK